MNHDNKGYRVIKDGADDRDLIRLFAEYWQCDAEVLSGSASSHSSAKINPISVENQAFVGKIESLKLRFNGRWGNYVFQLINIFHLAERLGVSTVYLHRTEMFPLKEPITINSIVVESVGASSEVTGFQLESVFFQVEQFGGLMSGLNPDRRREIAFKYVRPLMRSCVDKNAMIGNDDIVVHIRSGDLFQGEDGKGGSQLGGALYVQPPLSFYMMVINALRRPGTGHVIVIAEDTGNPVVIALVDNLVRYNHVVTLRSNHDLASDIGCLLNARTLVFANGTIGLAAALCSAVLEKAFFFREDSTGTSYNINSYIGDFCRKYFIQDSGYIQRAGWENTRDQRSKMVSFPQSSLFWDGKAPRQNVARGKPTRQSSVLPYVRSDANAVNGIITGAFSFHTELQDFPWWEVDLLGKYKISEVVIFNRCDVPDRAYGFQLWLLRSDNSWEMVHDQKGEPFGGAAGKPARIILDRAEATKVRIQLPKKEYLHLDEVEVYVDEY